MHDAYIMNAEVVKIYRNFSSDKSILILSLFYVQ